MSDANNEITSRKSNLFSKLEQAEKKHNRKANIYEILSAASFYLSLSFGGLAVLSGLIKSFNVPPEIISVFAAISSGLTVLPRQALFILKADWHYSARDTANNLLWKLQF